MALMNGHPAPRGQQRAAGASTPPRGLPYVTKPAQNTTEIRLNPGTLAAQRKRRLHDACLTRFVWSVIGYNLAWIVTVVTWDATWWVRFLAGAASALVLAGLAVWRGLRASNGRHR